MLEVEKIYIIIRQIKSDGLIGRFQAFDNITCFTSPEKFDRFINLFVKKIKEEYSTADLKIKERILKFLLLLAIALDGSYELKLNLQNKKRYGAKVLKVNTLKKINKNLFVLLTDLEKIDKETTRNVIESEKQRLMKIMSTRGEGLFAVLAKEIKAEKLTEWVKYWSEFGKKSNLRKMRENTKGLIGVDYGLGVIESRILWGADLVMMNPTLARLALAEDDELARIKNDFANKFRDKYDRAKLVREVTKIAGLKARYSLRAVFLLTGKGKISFQVNPRTYNQPDILENDIRSLHEEFNKEAEEYDSGLFIEETLTKKEIEERRSKSHVFFKVDGSSRNVYGNIENVMLKQIKERNIDLTKDSTDGVMEKVMSDGINCNVTVAGFVTDGLYAFFCQIRGHAKAREKNIPITHSIITKMGGRVEASLRWIVLDKLTKAVKDDKTALDVISKSNFQKNGTLDEPEIRKIAKNAGFILAEEIKHTDYEKYKGKIFPIDLAICTIAEAISKRSHKIMNDLKNNRLLRKEVLEWQTGDLQASMRGPYKGRYPHVEELVGMYAQGHFPDAALAIERWKTFKADSKAINKSVNEKMISQLYNSIILDEFALSYEVDKNLKEILTFFKVYKKEYGENGIKIDELSKHPFSHQTLFGKVIERLPETESEKDKVDSGFIGDFNKLGSDLNKLN